MFSVISRTNPSAEMQSVYSTAPADWAFKTLVFGVPYPSAEMQSVHSIVPTQTTGQWFCAAIIDILLTSVQSFLAIDYFLLYLYEHFEFFFCIVLVFLFLFLFLFLGFFNCFSPSAFAYFIYFCVFYCFILQVYFFRWSSRLGL